VPWARASEAHRWLHCPGSTVLPREEREAGEAARWGTAVHSWMAEGGEPTDPEFGHLVRKRLEYLTKDPTGATLREELWPADVGSHEVVIAIGPDGEFRAAFSGGTLEQRDAWKASRPEDEVVGTLDWLGELVTGGWVGDLKTGREPSSPTSDPMRVYSIGADALHGAPVATSIEHWPRSPWKGRPRRKWGEMTDDDIRAIKRDLAAARAAHVTAKAELAAGRDPKTIKGDWCDWCPCQNNCPSYKESP
jgi:hypothetical protein